MIDAHVHVWALDPEHFPWQQTLASVPIPSQAAEAEQLLAEMDRTGVSHAVLVQPSVYGWDNSYLCKCLARWPLRFAGVCLVNPRSAESPDKLSRLIRESGCKGLRINLIDEEDISWVLGPGCLPLWAKVKELGISVSMQMRPEHAPTIAALAGTMPCTIFIIDYLGMRAFHEASGNRAIDQLAPLDNIWTKILSLGMDSRRPFPFEDLWPLYAHAYRKFGASRLMFGTDFPHIYKASTYAAGFEWFRQLPFLDNSSRRAIGGENAKTLWNFTGA